MVRQIREGAFEPQAETFGRIESLRQTRRDGDGSGASQNPAARVSEAACADGRRLERARVPVMVARRVIEIPVCDAIGPRLRSADRIQPGIGLIETSTDGWRGIGPGFKHRDGAQLPTAGNQVRQSAPATSEVPAFAKWQREQTSQQEPL